MDVSTSDPVAIDAPRDLPAGAFVAALFRWIRRPNIRISHVRNSMRAAVGHGSDGREAIFHSLRTSDGRFLCINPDRNVVACRDADWPKLLLWSDDGRTGSLVADDLVPFTMGSVRYRALSAPVELFAGDGNLWLFARSEKRFLSLAGEHDEAPLCRGGRSSTEGTALVRAPPPAITRALRTYAAELRAVRDGGFRATDLRRTRFLAALASSAPGAPAATLQRLLGMAHARPRLLARLIGHDPADFWAANVLGPLVRPDIYPDGKTIGCDLDWLADEYVPESGCIAPRSFGEQLVYAYRRSLRGRDELCIVATARNEGLYLVDWIAYHLSIGVKRIHLYANENDDGSDALLAALDGAGHIRFVRSAVGENHNAQGKAYGHAFRVNRSVIESTWCLNCDLDEYFVFDTARFADCDDYIAFVTRGDTDAVTFRWGFVGPSRQVRWSPEPVIERFGAPPVFADNYAKSLFRTGAAAGAYPHFPIGASDRALTYRNAVGDIRTSVKGESEHRIWGRLMDDDPVTSMAFLCHYYYKSAEEFAVKHTRNRGDHPKKARLDELVMPPYHLTQFLKLFDGGDGPWPIGTPSACAPAVARLCEEIRSDPAVARAEAQVRDLYLRRRDTLVSSLVDSQAFTDLGEDAKAFKRLLAGGA